MEDIISRLSGNVYIPFCIGLVVLLIIFLIVFILIDISRWKQR